MNHLKATEEEVGCKPSTHEVFNTTASIRGLRENSRLPFLMKESAHR